MTEFLKRLPDKDTKFRVQSEMPESFKGLREKIIREVEQVEHDMNLERVFDFMNGAGFNIDTHLMVVDAESYKKILHILNDASFSMTKTEIEEQKGGSFISHLNLTLVVYNEEWRNDNGAVFMEGLVVHELAHASSGFKDYTVVEKDEQVFFRRRVKEEAALPRCGMTLKDGRAGEFWEEGFADFVRGRYLIEELSSDEHIDFLSRRGLPTDITIDHPLTITTKEGRLPISGKYIFVKGDTRSIWPSSFAGQGVEMLIKNDPSLWKAFLAARDSAEGIRQVIKQIEKVNKGLYRKMKTLEYTGVDFARGLLEIEAILERKKSDENSS